VSNRPRKRRPPAPKVTPSPAPVPTPPVTPVEADVTPAWQEWVIRSGGLAVGLVGGALLAVFGAFLTPFRIGGVLVPISLLLAVGGNLLLIWFTYVATQHKGLALGPSLVWVVLTFVASGRTKEGDYVLVQNNWVSVVYLLAGCVTIGGAAYRLILARER
jgi:hypothetical protein